MKRKSKKWEVAYKSLTELIHRNRKAWQIDNKHIVSSQERRYQEWEDRLNKTLDMVKEQSSQISDLIKRIWILENPAKFKIGDIVYMERYIGMEALLYKVCDLSVDHNSNGEYIWMYELSDGKNPLIDSPEFSLMREEEFKEYEESKLKK